MTDRISSFHSSPATSFWLEADVISQNVAANTSVVRIYLRAANGPGGSSGSFFGGYGQQIAYVNGGEVGRVAGNPFLPSGVPDGGQRWRSGPYDVTVGHNPQGYLSITLTMGLAYGNVNVAPSTTLTLPRIPKVPDAPTPVTIDQITSSSFRYRFTGNSDNGSGMVEFQSQVATNSGFTANVKTMSNLTGAHTYTGVLPGNTYYARSRGRNGVGWGPWSRVISAFVGLPAPTLTSWSQDSSGGLVATWSAPSATTGLTGYRLQIARDAAFTTGVQNIDVGNVLTRTVTGLAGGRVYYARVAARTAGGINAFSSSRNTMLVLAAGELDGWTRFGGKPAAINYYTAAGIRRGSVGTAPALYLESLSTAAVNLAANTYGIQKTVTGLTVGKAYRFEAFGTLTGSPLAKVYRLEVVNEADGANVTLSTTSTALPPVEFVADASTVILRIRLASAVTVPGANDAVERVGFHGIKLLELATDYPVRLRETVFESNLANHFDLACNSVGASWNVGMDGTTRFVLPGTALPVSAVFTDETDDDALHYVDISAAYDTRGMFNRLDVTNYGVDAERVNEENDELVAASDISIFKNGTRTVRLETNLYSLPPYDESLNKRLSALLDANDEPTQLISQLRWNAQENVAMAHTLDVGQRVTVRYRGTEQDSQIVSVQHDITPDRWMVTLNLQKVGP